MHRFAPPSREAYDVVERRHGALVAVSGEHAPSHVVDGGQREERRAAVPVARPEAPKEAEEIEREPRVHERPQGEPPDECRPAGGWLHTTECSREACRGRWSGWIVTAYDGRQRTRRRG